LQEIHWASAWILQLLGGRDLESATRARDRLSAVLDQMAGLSRHGKLQQGLFESVNALRVFFGCTRVSLGLVKGHQVRLMALSEAAEFDRHSALSKAYVEAMSEAMDVGQALRVDGEAVQQDSLSRLAALRTASGAQALVAQPLRFEGQVIAVVVLERTEGNWSDQDLEWLDAFSAMAAPLVRFRQQAEHGVLRRAKGRLEELFHRLFGPGYLTWKAAGLVLLVLALLMAVPIPYRVSAKTVIEGEVHRVLAAPFDGFLQQVQVRPGDTVRAGQVMASLDDRDLKIEKDQNASRLREAMANHDLAATAQIQAQVAQAEAQLALVKQKLDRSVIRAPFDGVVVSGDLSQELGASIEVGKRLFEVAPLQSYRIVLQVDERDIRHIRLGQPGTIVMTGLAGDPMDFSVNAVTPVATAEDGQNFFRVEARLSGELPRLRPGMEGVGKIETERRSIGWILTHKFTDWLRLYLWNWLP
jgi:Barrel-sandwich domain of CusB or HlyD membrane-fusion/GAF domain